MAEKPGSAISRREFARRAALASAIGSAVVSIGPSGAVAAGITPVGTRPPESANQAPTAASPTAASPTAASPTASSAAAQAQLPADMPRLSPESQAEAGARFQAILAQYGGRFSEERKTDLRRLCIMAQPPLDRLRAYPVQNGDGTALYLKPLFEREKKPKPPSISQPGGAKPPAAAPAGAAPPATSGAAKQP